MAIGSLLVAQNLKFWQQQNFFAPALPKGYTKVEQPLPGAQVANNPPRQANLNQRTSPNQRGQVVPASGQTNPRQPQRR